MKSLSLRIWAIVALTLALGASLIRLVWGIGYTREGSSLAIIILIIAAIIGSYALILYLAVKPSLKKLKSLPVAVLTTVIAGGGIIGCTIHFMRFVPSPWAYSPISLLIAGLFLASVVIAGGLALWLVWRFRGRG
jgi:hypothetical protein